VPDLVIEMCEAVWPKDKSDCSAFVRDVGDRLGVALTGDANAIVDTLRHKWRRLHDGAAALAACAEGYFVVAGLKGSEQHEPSPHGHVVVVVNGPMDHGKYPTAYWGRLGGIGERHKTLNYAWREADRDRITYAAAPDS
jgi:hypothetical protein